MSLESLLPSYSDLGNMSLFVLLVVAALFYFGKLITSVKIAQYEKEDYYIEGFFFSFSFIVIPFFIVLAFSPLLSSHLNSLLSTLTKVVVVGVIQIIVMVLLYAAVSFNLGRFTLLSQFRSAYKKEFEKQKKTSPIIKSAQELKVTNLEEASFAMLAKLADRVCNYYTIFIISLLLVCGAYATYVSPPPNILLSSNTISILVYMLTFLNFTLLALAYGYVGLYNPPAIIYFEDGQKIEGKIVKMGKYIYVAKEDEKKILFVNSSKVIRIEEGMFKEGTEQSGETEETVMTAEKKETKASKAKSASEKTV